MKSDIFENRFYVECTCGSIDQVLVFHYWEWEDDPDPICEVFFSDSAKWSFFKRLKNAFNYLFWREPYTYGCVVVEKNNIQQLEDVLKFLVEKMK